MFVYADEIYSARLAYGKASSNDLGNIISGDLGSHPKDLTALAVDAGYLWKKNILNLPIDVYLKGGVSYFNEDAHDDVYEALIYIKAFYNIDFLDNRIRIGFGECGSYVSRVLETEHDEAADKNDNTSNYLNYLDISMDFDFGKLLNYKQMQGTYVGVLLKHRSGISGLINDVKHGGSNYNCVYLEKNF